MKTEQALMCALFVLCTLAVVGAMATMLSVHIPPVQLTHAAVTHLTTASG